MMRPYDVIGKECLYYFVKQPNASEIIMNLAEKSSGIKKNCEKYLIIFSDNKP